MRRRRTDFGADFPFIDRKPHVLAPVAKPTDAICGRAKRRSEIFNVAAAATFGRSAVEQAIVCEFGVVLSQGWRTIRGLLPFCRLRCASAFRVPSRFRKDATPCGFPLSAGRPKIIETRTFRLRIVDYFLIRYKVTARPVERMRQFVGIDKLDFEPGEIFEDSSLIWREL